MQRGSVVGNYLILKNSATLNPTKIYEFVKDICGTLYTCMCVLLFHDEAINLRHELDINRFLSAHYGTLLVKRKNNICVGDQGVTPNYFYHYCFLFLFAVQINYTFFVNFNGHSYSMTLYYLPDGRYLKTNLTGCTLNSRPCTSRCVFVFSHNMIL